MGDRAWLLAAGAHAALDDNLNGGQNADWLDWPFDTHHVVPHFVQFSYV